MRATLSLPSAVKKLRAGVATPALAATMQAALHLADDTVTATKVGSTSQLVSVGKQTNSDVANVEMNPSGNNQMVVFQMFV